MDRQPLTDRLGDRLLAEYGGAAAAYSLRALNGNGDSVVRVRRASDNDEEDFTAEQIELGEMVNWVNSQTVPPLDIGVETSEGRIPVPEGGTSIGTPAAAYSLRNLSTTYTGNVVDVRRSSGGTESFTAAEVADGTLTDWVNTDYAKYSSDFTSNDDGWGSFDDVTETGAVDGIGGLDGNLRLAIGSATSQHRAYKTNILPENQKINFSARVFIPSTNSVVDGLQVLDAVGNTIINATSLTQDQWVTVTANDVTTTNSQLRVNLLDGSLTSFTGNSSDVVYLREITVTQVTSDGFVTKWYDQSGNDNHATQGTAASQPKIVDGGSLVSGGIVFDTGETLAKTGLSISSPLNAFIVSTADTEHNGAILKLAASVSQQYRTDRKLLLQYSDLQFTGSNVYTVGEQNLQSLQFVAGTSVGFFNGTQVLSGTTAGQTVTEFRLGNTGSFGLDGKINEVIIYNSDQSANRTAIEANIGETYGITGIPAYDNTVDGFVETWYDQSGNGRDATQSVATKQPKIVDAGVLVSGDTGEPAFTGDGVDDILSLSSSINFGTGEFFVSTVVDVDNTGGVVIGSASPNWMLLVTTSSIQVRSSNTNTIYIISPDSVLTAGESYLISLSRVGNDITAYVNGVAQADVETVVSTDTFSADRFLQRGTNGNPYPDPVSEVIIYASDQSANRVGIETNINDHYNIY
jgi:hypothetical protein